MSYDAVREAITQRFKDLWDPNQGTLLYPNDGDKQRDIQSIEAKIGLDLGKDKPLTFGGTRKRISGTIRLTITAPTGTGTGGITRTVDHFLSIFELKQFSGVSSGAGTVRPQGDATIVAEVPFTFEWTVNS